MVKYIIALLLSSVCLPASAGIIMTITDDGTDLTMAATGTYDNTGLAVIGSVYFGATGVVTGCCIGWETGVGTSANFAASYVGSLTQLSDILFPTSSVTTSNPFWFWTELNRITFRTSAPIVGSVNESATLEGATLATFGMVSGESVSVTWGQNTATIQTFAGQSVSVPAPATLALVGIGLAGIGCNRRKKA